MNREAANQSDHRSDPTYLEWNAATREFLMRGFEKVGAEREVWAIETMKHIALIALAGLGGVFALLGAAKGNAKLIFWAATCFAVGSALCVVGMFIGAHIRNLYMSHIGRLLKRLTANEIFSQADFNEPASMKRWNLVANGLGWIAAILTAVGGIFLFQSLP